MFEVRSISPLDEHWEERDVQIRQAAGCASDESSAGSSKTMRIGQREHVWRIKDFQRAVAMKNRLNRIDGVRATVREGITEDSGGGKKKR